MGPNQADNTIYDFHIISDKKYLNPSEIMSALKEHFQTEYPHPGHYFKIRFNPDGTPEGSYHQDNDNPMRVVGGSRVTNGKPRDMPAGGYRPTWAAVDAVYHAYLQNKRNDGKSFIVIQTTSKKLEQDARAWMNGDASSLTDFLN